MDHVEPVRNGGEAKTSRCEFFECHGIVLDSIPDAVDGQEGEVDLRGPPVANILTAITDSLLKMCRDGRTLHKTH